MARIEELNHKQIKWITTKAVRHLRRLVTSRSSFYDDFDEWAGYTIPQRLGGGTVDVNYYIYGDNRLRATVYGYDDENIGTITSNPMEVKSYKVRIKS